MRRLVAITTLAGALALAAAALAVLPKGGSHYKGKTSAPTIIGAGGKKFTDPVTFTVASNSRSLTAFKFGEPSCQGSGGPPPTKNPYTASFEAAKLGGVPVAADGKFSVTKNLVVGGTPTATGVSGKFSTNRKTHKVIAKGTLSFTQHVTGGGQCTGHLSFTAAPK
jgi:hypothetical protein